MKPVIWEMRVTARLCECRVCGSRSAYEAETYFDVREGLDMGVHKIKRRMIDNVPLCGTCNMEWEMTEKRVRRTVCEAEFLSWYLDKSIKRQRTHGNSGPCHAWQNECGAWVQCSRHGIHERNGHWFCRNCFDNPGTIAKPKRTGLHHIVEVTVAHGGPEMAWDMVNFLQQAR